MPDVAEVTVQAGRAPPARCCLITVWATGPGVFAASAVLPDGTRHDFSGPFELARFFGALAALPAPALPASPTGAGLR